MAGAADAVIAEVEYQIANLASPGSIGVGAEYLVRAVARVGTEDCRDVVLRLTAAAQTLWRENTLYAVVRIAALGRGC